MKTSTDSVRMAGQADGTSTPTSVRKCPAPSTRAASVTERGVERKNPRIQNVPSVTETPIWGRIRAGRLSSIRQSLNIWYSGMISDS